MKVSAIENLCFIRIIIIWKLGGQKFCRSGNKSNKRSISNYIFHDGNRMLFNGETYRDLIICQNYMFQTFWIHKSILHT